MVLFSVLARGYGAVLLGTGATVLAIYLLSLLPKLTKYMPTSLMNSGSLLVGVGKSDEFIAVAVITTVASVACIVISIPIFNKKQI